ncbi:MAG: hypothetical protein V3V08_09925 [Nannocystaceae bacterium]
MGHTRERFEPTDVPPSRSFLAASRGSLCFRPPRRGLAYTGDIVRRSARTVTAMVMGVLLGAVVACSSSASLAVAQWSMFESGPAPPVRGLPVPAMPQRWRPPSLVAGDVVDLRVHLSGLGGRTVLVDERLVITAGRERLKRALAALGLGGPLVPLSPDHLVAADIPVVRQPESDAAPGPRYRADVVRISADWIEAARVHGDRIVVIADAPVDLRQWNRMPSHVDGGCQTAIASLATGQEQSLAMIERFLDYADRLLAESFRQELARHLPVLQARLDAYRLRRPAQGGVAGENGDTEARERGGGDGCVASYERYLRWFGRCLGSSSACRTSPRLLLSGWARVGLPLPPVVVAERCARDVGRDFPDAFSEMATRAARRVAHYEDLDWSERADRLATFSRVAEVVETICAPRRRRFTEADLVELDGRLDAIVDVYRSPVGVLAEARWRFASFAIHVPGLGAFREVARFDAGPGSLSQRIREQAAGMQAFAVQRELCRTPSNSRPLALLVLDTQTGRASYFGLFYEEELFCADLPPR